MLDKICHLESQIRDNYGSSCYSTAMKELLFLFLRLGFFAFGGPAAHIAMLEHECVEKRQWLSKEEFLDLIALTNLIPGPNSTEMVLHMGYLKAKGKGMIIAGLAFILPAMSMVLALAYVLKEFGSLPAIESILISITPVIVALIASVGFKLSSSQLNNTKNLLLFIFAFLLSLFGLKELTILLLTGIVYILVDKLQTKTFVVEPLSLLGLFLIFLKIGSVLYGSGYVLLSFLNSELLHPGYLDAQTIIDALTIGQLTPGPVFTTATAIGYFMLDIPGAIVATIGIFLPSFLFVYFLHPLFPKMKQNKILKSILEGVRLASLALIFKVVYDLGLNLNAVQIAFAVGSFILLIKTKLNPTWLILAMGSYGFILSLVA